jgi:hypothetical protein
MLKNALLAKKTCGRDFPATVQRGAERAFEGSIPSADPYTEDTKKHLIPV